MRKKTENKQGSRCKTAREKEKVKGSKLNLRNLRILDVKFQSTLGLLLLG
jgi:hypothetical protein